METPSHANDILTKKRQMLLELAELCQIEGDLKDKFVRLMLVLLSSGQGVVLLTELAPSYMRALRTLNEVFDNKKLQYTQLREHLQELSRLAERHSSELYAQNLLDILQEDTGCVGR